jgi:hypothetical protein
LEGKREGQSTEKRKKSGRRLTHLSSRRVQPKSVTKLLLRNGTRSVDLVTKNEEGNLVQLLDSEEGVKFRLGLVEALGVLRIDEEDDTVDFGEVVLPEAAS